MSDFKLHLIGNAHIDPVWLWRWTEGKEETLRTYRQAIVFMKEFPDFIFNASQAGTYKWVEEDDPGLFSEIQRYVKEGRWNIVNGWWMEPDCNIPSGESFARQSLYGKLYFREKFGADVKVAYNVDAFGHCAGLPQIFKKSGMDYYVFLRPIQSEKALEERIFWWQGCDGTKILTWRIHGSYNSSGGWDVLLPIIEDTIKNKIKVLNEDMCFYGVGDHGGGPTREEILGIKNFKKEGYEFILSTPDAFFKNVISKKKDLMLLNGDLQYHSRGCYTVVSWIKQANRQSENLLLSAEKFSSIAELINIGQYPLAKISESWQKVLFNQFHDVLCGTSIKEAYDDSKKDYEAVFQDGGEVLNKALSGIASKIDTTAKGRSVILFNSLGWNRKEAISIDVEEKNIKIIDPKGKEIPFQQTLVLDTKPKITFSADVPAFGFNTFHILPSIKRRKWNSLLKAVGSSLENDMFFLQINPLTGNIIHLFDKKKKRNIIAQGREANEMLVMEDLTDTWSHTAVSFDKLIGKFLIQGKPEVIEEGPVKITLRVKSTFLNSEMTQDISIYDKNPRIDFDTRLKWHEKFKMLKVGFAFALKSESAVSEIPYGTIERKNSGGEEPGQTWLDMSGDIINEKTKIKYGVSLLNDCKYGYSVKDNEIRLSLVRSPIFAWHDPKVLEPGVEYQHTDQGEHHFKYSLLMHEGSWQKINTPKYSMEFNNPLVVREESAHSGVLKKSVSFIEIKPCSVNLITFKKEENGKNYILRIFESCGKKTTVQVRSRLLKLSFKAQMKPYEIKTYRVFCNTKKSYVEECNLIEDVVPLK